MPKLVFDIETIGEDFDSFDKATQDNLTRWIKKEAKNDAEYKILLEDLKDGLGFSPLTGSIVAIGVLDADKDIGVVYFQAPNKEVHEFKEESITYKPCTEEEMLRYFWEGAKKYDEFVSFNGRGFDVPFMLIRSAIHKIHPTKDLMSNRYLNSQRYDAKHVDLQDLLTFYGSVRRKGSLHMWTRAFGIESPKAGGVIGDDVKALFEAEHYEDIARYNARDIIATKELYEYWDTYLRFS